MKKKIIKRILFIDRDGTIIEEPPSDFQVDTLKKLSFKPFVISSLQKIANDENFELVMVTNQDGLGTSSFPEKKFWLVHNKMMDTLKNEGIYFKGIHIDSTFEHENAPTRKPGTKMLESYLKKDYDITNSFVIGDRVTDIQLAKNLGCKAIYFSTKKNQSAALCTDSWEEIYKFLKYPNRKVNIQRSTHETDISINLDLDIYSAAEINTGLGFFDHMLEQVAKHAHIGLKIKVKGDLHVDEHHTIEDVGICLGESFLKALGDKKSIYRYGFLLPMDDALAQVALDFSGRSWLIWQVIFKREKIGDVPTEMFYHFFKSFCDTAKCNLNIKVEGDNEHHKIESIFKAFAHAIKMAIKIDKNNDTIPSTKGNL